MYRKYHTGYKLPELADWHVHICKGKKIKGFHVRECIHFWTYLAKKPLSRGCHSEQRTLSNRFQPSLSRLLQANASALTGTLTNMATPCGVLPHLICVEPYKSYLDIHPSRSLRHFHLYIWLDIPEYVYLHTCASVVTLSDNLGGGKCIHFFWISYSIFILVYPILFTLYLLTHWDFMKTNIFSTSHLNLCLNSKNIPKNIISDFLVYRVLL